MNINNLNNILKKIGYKKVKDFKKIHHSSYLIKTYDEYELVVKTTNNSLLRKYRIFKEKNLYSQINKSIFNTFDVFFKKDFLISKKIKAVNEGEDVIYKYPSDIIKYTYLFQNINLKNNGFVLKMYNLTLDNPIIRISGNIHKFIRFIGFKKYCKILYLLVIKYSTSIGSVDFLNHGDIRGNILEDTNRRIYLYDFESYYISKLFMGDVMHLAYDANTGKIDFNIINNYIKLIKKNPNYDLGYIKKQIQLGLLLCLTNGLGTKSKNKLNNKLNTIDFITNTQDFFRYLDKKLLF
ncbi:hypothetical protein LAT59_04720 [Candidatus Gracilibacteria bacterium]|nr:hypothetical protein [Candidatus Gracilibacteria bacterium]